MVSAKALIWICVGVIFLLVLIMRQEQVDGRNRARQQFYRTDVATESIFVVWPIVDSPSQTITQHAHALINLFSTAAAPDAVTVGVAHLCREETYASDPVGQDLVGEYEMQCRAKGQPVFSERIRYQRYNQPEPKFQGDPKVRGRTTAECARKLAIGTAYADEDFVLFLDMQSKLLHNWDVNLKAALMQHQQQHQQQHQHQQQKKLKAKTNVAITCVPQMSGNVFAFGKTPEHVAPVSPGQPSDWACSALLFASSQVLHLHLPDAYQADDMWITSWAWTLKLRSHGWTLRTPTTPIAIGPLLPPRLAISTKRRQRLRLIARRAPCNICGMDVRQHTTPDLGHAYSTHSEYKVPQLGPFSISSLEV